MVKSTKAKDQKNESKTRGKVYTPNYLVCLILDYAGYSKDEDILNHHIIDNSCGDGAFLCEIVRRYCQAYLRRNGNCIGLKNDLETYIHGIEIDKFEHQLCLSNLNFIVTEYIDLNIEWDVICGNTLCIDRYNNRMDYVVGNPPYVRVHNLEKTYDDVKSFSFAQQGMTDLYIVFFEIGFKMLSSKGIMCIITPSSWLTSKAGEVLRKYVSQHHNMSGVIDLEWFQAFNATTYTLISKFDKQRHNTIEYNTFDENGLHQCNTALPYSEFVISRQFFLSDIETLRRLRGIRSEKVYSFVKVKNGFATLADKVFIGDFVGEYTIPVIKASTGQYRRCIFPYDNNGQLIPEENLCENEIVYQHLHNHKEELTLGRSAEREDAWYAFGRSQAIKDVYTPKIVINSLVKDISSIKLSESTAGVGVYSGLYILTKLPFSEISDIIISDDFISYIAALKNYKSGGYYTFSSKDLEQYLNYIIQKRHEQPNLSSDSNSLF